jgi:hypothetical protein
MEKPMDIMGILNIWYHYRFPYPRIPLDNPKTWKNLWKNLYI